MDWLGFAASCAVLARKDRTPSRLVPFRRRIHSRTEHRIPPRAEARLVAVASRTFDLRNPPCTFRPSTFDRRASGLPALPASSLDR
jgi:hypothetical protein